MDVLPKHFLVYKYFDMWSENNENLKYLKKFNKYLTGFGLLHYLFTAIGVVLHLSSDISEVSEVLYMLISVIGATIRFFFIIYHQESLMSIIKDYRLPSCQRKSAEEKVIYKKYQGAAFFDWVFLIVSTVMVGTLISLGPLFIRVNGEMQLPLPSYNILGLPDKIFFYSTYVLQVTMLHQATCIGISFDILVHSFLILAAGQLEILKHRFQSLNLNQENVIDRLIEHHLIIQRIISKVQKTFMGVIAIIFAMSFESFCTSIFQLTQVFIHVYYSSRRVYFYQEPIFSEKSHNLRILDWFHLLVGDIDASVLLLLVWQRSSRKGEYCRG